MGKIQTSAFGHSTQGLASSDTLQFNIQSSIDNLDAALSELSARLSHLSERLNPVTRQEPVNEAKENNIRHMSPIGTRIEGMRQQVDRMIHAVGLQTELLDI